MKQSPWFGRVAAAGAAFFVTLSVARAENPPERTEQSAVTPTIKDSRRHDEFLYRIKEGEIDLLFLGDSITDSWPRGGEWSWLKFAPYRPANFGVSGDRTEHVLWRIQNGELEGIRPKVAVVMIGTNNIGQDKGENPEWTAGGVKKILEVIREKLPSTKVLLLGVFPRDAKDSQKRAATVTINEIISKYGDGNKVQYLDIGRVFLDANGEILTDVMPDRLHPNAKGYDLWYDAIAPTLEKMMK